jgi:hypothetical protein
MLTDRFKNRLTTLEARTIPPRRFVTLFAYPGDDDDAIVAAANLGPGVEPIVVHFVAAAN